MFLRWMVRTDGIVDFGIWQTVFHPRQFNKPSTEIIGLSAFPNHLFSLIYIISEQGEIAQARIIREDMRQGLGYLERRFQGGGSLLCQTKFQ